MRPDSPFLAKAEGMVRFYLQGRLPLDKQSCPEPLKATLYGSQEADTSDNE